jgi:hypothetical protein
LANNNGTSPDDHHCIDIGSFWHVGPQGLAAFQHCAGAQWIRQRLQIVVVIIR